MLSLARAVAAALAISVPAAAAAGITLSLRTGWAIPAGDAAAGEPLGDLFEGFVPLQLDLGYDLTERLQLGLYAQYGFADAECSGECDGRSIRAGVQALYALGAAGATFSAWVGAGAGFEHARHETTEPDPFLPGGPDVVTRADLGGWEVNVEGGTAWMVFPRLAVGPYLLLAVGRYEGGSLSALSDKAMHAWVHLGLRGSVGL